MKSNEKSVLEDEATKTAIDARTLKLLYLGDSKIKLSANMSLDAIEDLNYRFVGSLNLHSATFANVLLQFIIG